MAKRFIERVRRGGGFDYVHDGQLVTNKDELAYFKSLGIPPAWKDVKIAASRNARILATGLDKADRLQYVYHPKFRAKQEHAKFERILRFAKALPSLRRQIRRDLARPKIDQRRVLAAVIELMDTEHFRVGNEVYARENQSYGLTTMRSKHVNVRSNQILFHFTGKSGQDHLKRITDRRIVKLIKQLDELPGYEIFKYYGADGQLQTVDSAEVNSYIKELMGDEFTAKDFRTWGGTIIAASELIQIERPTSLRERRKVVTICVNTVAKRLGNTPAIARASYIDPRIIKAFVESNELTNAARALGQIKKLPHLTNEEHCVLALLEKAA